MHPVSKHRCYILLPYPNCELANQKPCLLSWFSTILSHWPDILRYHGQFVKLAFFADFRGENYNRNTTKRKTITLVKRESNLFNGKRGKKNTISRQNWKRLHWRALAWSLRIALKLFWFQNGTGFSKFLSKLGLPRFRKWNSKQKN